MHIKDPATTFDQELYKELYARDNDDYHKIFGIRIVCTVKSEVQKGEIARKVVEYAKSLQDENLIVQHAYRENPKINKDGVFAYKDNILHDNMGIENTIYERLNRLYKETNDARK
jgi:hypothetical protein